MRDPDALRFEDAYHFALTDLKRSIRLCPEDSPVIQRDAEILCRVVSINPFERTIDGCEWQSVVLAVREGRLK